MGIRQRLTTLWRFVSDLCTDSHAALTFAAPVFTVGLFFAKLFGLEVPVLDLKNISYAWVFAPIAVWLFVGYVRRWKMTDRSQAVRKLQLFYAEAEAIRMAPTNDFNKYLLDAEGWINSTGEWIRINMGEHAEARFLDVTNMAGARYNGAINDVHNTCLKKIAHYRRNLKEMIENPVWH